MDNLNNNVLGNSDCKEGAPKNKPHCTMILLAGGSGKRMGSKVAKQYLEINEKPILWYSLMAVEKSEVIDECILVIRPDDAEYVRDELLAKYFFTKVTRIADAGKERYESVWSALVSLKNINWMAIGPDKQEELLADEKLSEDLPTDYIFIHDGARPFLTEEIIKRNYDEVIKSGACVTAVKSKDTVKIVDDNGNVISTPNRNNVRNIQTPQTFKAGLIFEAYRRAIYDEREDLTDDAMTVEISGLATVSIAEGSYDNIKITTPEDLTIAEIFSS
ncbi:MAG: 2-C-methyl-D-erythritol 4-phosphate cytidylyltransferase [Lachnospiraceae bacterium]|nr:2-C-methyl-D-erythritol 4-phosphate cytidylyltransferase [Lachnospiraceae bacterium]